QAPPGQGPVKLPRLDPVQHPGVDHLDPADPATGAVLGHDRPEALHVRKLWHGDRPPYAPPEVTVRRAGDPTPPKPAHSPGPPDIAGPAASPRVRGRVP